MGASSITHGTDWETGFSLLLESGSAARTVFSGNSIRKDKGFSFPMFKSFRSEKSAELFHHQPGLEYWFKGKRRASVYQSQSASDGIGAANECWPSKPRYTGI